MVIIEKVTVAHSTVTGVDGDNRGAGLAVQTDPQLESLNSHQVWQLAQAVKDKLEGVRLPRGRVTWW